MKNYNKYSDVSDFGKAVGLSKEETSLIRLRTDLIKKIILERKRQGLTQGELAKQLNTKQSHISRIEGGTMVDVSLSYLLKILDELGIEVNIKTQFKKAA